MISLHGLVPNCQSGSRLPYLAACALDASRLNIPLSPDLLSTNAVHSRMNVSMSGFSVYDTELLANALCGAVSHHCPDLA